MRASLQLQSLKVQGKTAQPPLTASKLEEHGRNQTCSWVYWRPKSTACSVSRGEHLAEAPQWQERGRTLTCDSCLML